MRTFTLIWFGQLVSAIGSRMTFFALTLWAWEATGSATALALVGLFFQLPQIPTTLFAGVIVDRFNRKTLMLLGDATTAIATLIIGGLSLTQQIKIEDKEGTQSWKTVDELLTLRTGETPDFPEPSPECPYDPDYCQNFFDLCQAPGTALQASMVAGLQASLASINPDDIQLPTSLYLLQFCDSSLQYVLEQELPMLIGNYAILQEIAVTSLSQLFSVVDENTGGQDLSFEQLLALRTEGIPFLIDGYGCGVQEVLLGQDCQYIIDQENWAYTNVDNSVLVNINYDLVVRRDCGAGVEEVFRENKSATGVAQKKFVYTMDPNHLLQHGSGHLGSIRLSTTNPSGQLVVDLNPKTVQASYPYLPIDTSHLYYNFGIPNSGNTPSLFNRAIKRIINYAISEWSNGINPPHYTLSVSSIDQQQGLPPLAISIGLGVTHNPTGPYVGIDPQNARYSYFPDGVNEVQVNTAVLERHSSRWGWT